MNVDDQFKLATYNIQDAGIETKGRTETNRFRLLTGVNLQYDCSDGKMGAFTLRANNPDLAITETVAFLMGVDSVNELEQAHPALKLWDAWACDHRELGGVYSEAFHSQYPKVVKGLIDNPLSTHHRMTTLIPDKFPIPGNTYDENVKQGKYSLMPCLHSYHFLSDGESLFLHATQASADIPVGVFPHNVYQVQFMLLFTAKLTGLKPVMATHHIHDAHIYMNQMAEVEIMQKRDSSDHRIDVGMHMELDELKSHNVYNIRNRFFTSDFSTQGPLKMKVDS